MQIRYFLLFLPVLLFLQNCRKEDSDFFATKDDLVPLYFLSDTFTCTAKKEVPGLGSIDWTSNIIATQWKEKLFFTFITFESAENPYIRERLSFSNIPPQKGVHELGSVAMRPSCSYSRWLGDGDLLHAGWKLDTTKENWLEVVQLDTVARMVRGKFDVHLIIHEQGGLGILHSERINFKKGNFETRY
jgi:hypothetical protein